MTPLIMGIIAIVCTVLAYIPGMGFLSFLGLIFGIIAWVMGKKAVDADPYDSKAKAGKIIGMVVTILAIIGVVLFIVTVIGLIACAAGLAGTGALADIASNVG